MTRKHVIDLALADSLLTKDWRPLAPYWSSDRELLLNSIAHHRLTNLLCLTLDKKNIPEDFKRAMQQRFEVNRLWESQHSTILQNVLSQFGQNNIHPILFKGTALAYSAYADPLSRDRGDSDILIQPDNYRLASDILLSEGFITEPSIGAKYNIESEFVFIDKFGLRHWIDLHRQISICRAYAKHFPYQTLAANAVSIPFGDNQVKILGPIDAMLIACFHYHETLNSSQSNNHPTPNQNLLLWLYDLHLLSQDFTEKHWAQLLDVASKTGLSGSCSEALILMRRYFDTDINLVVLEKLQEAVRNSAIDKYLKASRTRRRLYDVAHQESFLDKFGMLFEVLFPNTEFMKAKYPDAWPSSMIFLYVRRLLSGAHARLWSS